MMRGEAGQDHGGERDAEHAERKLDQAIRVVQPRDAARGEERRDQRVEQQGHLRHRRTENRGQHEPADPLHALVLPAPARSPEQAELEHEGQLETELHETRHEHADGQHDAGPREMRRNEGGEHDHDQVHERGRRRRHGELAVAVQHAARERRQRDEEDVGEGPAQHVDREVEAIAVGAEARREQQHQQRRGDDADDGDHREEPGHRAHRPVDQFADFVVFALDLVLGNDRHERL